MKQQTKSKEIEIVKKRRNKLKDFLPLIWSSYQHMYDVRKTNIDNRTNFLLVIISFLSIISITFFTYFENNIFLFSALFQLIAFIILLKSFFIKGGSAVHWFEFKETLENIEKDKFNEDLFATLKALEDNTYVYLIEMRNIIRVSLYCLVFSIYTILSALAFVYFEGMFLYVLIVFLTICLLSVIYIYHKKQPKFNFDENYKKYKKEIEEWLIK